MHRDGLPRTIVVRYLNGDDVEYVLEEENTVANLKVAIASRQDRFAPEVLLLALSGEEIIHDAGLLHGPMIIQVVLNAVTYDDTLWGTASLMHALAGDRDGVKRAARAMDEQAENSVISPPLAVEGSGRTVFGGGGGEQHQVVDIMGIGDTPVPDDIGNWGPDDDVYALLNQLPAHGLLPLYRIYPRPLSLSDRTLALSLLDYFTHPSQGVHHAKKNEVVDILIDARADVNFTTLNGTTCLLEAATGIGVGPEIMETLLNARADITHCDHGGWNALEKAASRGNREVCEYLINAKCNVNHSDFGGYTSLDAGASMGHADICDMLCTNGAYIDHQNSRGCTALMWGASRGHVDVVNVLLDAKADVNKKDYDECTALRQASRCGHVHVVETLIKRKAEVNVVSTSGWTALFLAASGGYARVCKCLLDAGACVDHVNMRGQTALRQACLVDSVEVARVLVEARANINQEDNGGKTPLQLACRSGNSESVTFLLGEKDINVNHEGGMDKKTSLWLAAARGEEAICKKLIEARADVNAADIRGRMPLWEAAFAGHIGVVKLLLGTPGTRVNGKDNLGTSCVDQAFERNHFDIVDLLLSHGTKYARSGELERYVLQSYPNSAEEMSTSSGDDNPWTPDSDI